MTKKRKSQSFALNKCTNKTPNKTRSFTRVVTKKRKSQLFALNKCTNKTRSFTRVVTKTTTTTSIITTTTILQDENEDEIANLYICVLDTSNSTRKYNWFNIDPHCTREKQVHFDPLTPLCQMPDSTPIGFQVVVLGSKIYTLGGFTWNYITKGSSVEHTSELNSSNKVFVCDTLDSPPMWKESCPMKLERRSPAVAADNGSLFAIGSLDKNICNSNPFAEVFDLSTQTWSSLPSPPQGSVPTENSVFVKEIGKIIVFSREWGDSPAYAFDCKTQLWKNVPISPENRMNVISYRAKSVAVGNIIYTFRDRRLYALDMSQLEPRAEQVYGLSEGIKKMPDYHSLVVHIVHIGKGKMCLVWYAGSSQKENSILIYCLKFWVGTAPGESRLHSIIDRCDEYIADGNEISNCLTI